MTFTIRNAGIRHPHVFFQSRYCRNVAYRTEKLTHTIYLLQTSSICYLNCFYHTFAYAVFILSVSGIRLPTLFLSCLFLAYDLPTFLFCLFLVQVCLRCFYAVLFLAYDCLRCFYPVCFWHTFANAVFMLSFSGVTFAYAVFTLSVSGVRLPIAVSTLAVSVLGVS